MRILHIFLFSILFAILLAILFSPANPKVTSYQLAVQWPSGVCTGNSGVDCKIHPVPKEFKIHGLWPDPDGPPSSDPYDLQKISNISSQLNDRWPNLESRQQQIVENVKFWKKEWDKHGKYSEMGVHAYFNKTLELYKVVGEGLKGKLVAEKITPTDSTTYKLQDIEAALKKINDGFSCTVVCNERYIPKKKQIQEIRFKYSNTFKMQNNGPSLRCGTSTTDVMFPLMQ